MNENGFINEEKIGNLIENHKYTCNKCFKQFIGECFDPDSDINNFCENCAKENILERKNILERERKEKEEIERITNSRPFWIRYMESVENE